MKKIICNNLIHCYKNIKIQQLYKNIQINKKPKHFPAEVFFLSSIKFLILMNLLVVRFGKLRVDIKIILTLTNKENCDNSTLYCH